MYLTPVAVTLVLLFGIMVESKSIFKLGPKLQAVSGVVGIVMVIWGWTIVSSATEENCRLDPDKMSPHQFMLILLILQAVLCGCLCCCMCLAICAMVAAVAASDGPGPQGSTIGAP